MPQTLDAPPRLLTAEEYYAIDGNDCTELVRGEVIVMPPPGYRHGAVQARLIYELMKAIEHHGAGVVTGDSGVVTERNPDTVRGPDVTFRRFEPAEKSVYPSKSPDLVVEVLSPSNSVEEMETKIEEYIGAGVQIVWVIDPEERTLTAYRTLSEPTVFLAEDTATLGELLPTFSCPVSKFFQ
jgi:Uma2 family endonuclease